MSRQSLARGRTTSGIVEDHKPSGTLSGVLSGGLKSTGKLLGDHLETLVT